MRKYRHPPIIERALSVGVDLNEEIFHRRFESWKPVALKAFPELEIITLWDLEVEEKDGMPSLSPNQNMSIRHRFWRKDVDSGKAGLQIWSDRLVFNLVGSRAHPGVFAELNALAMEWIQVWANHFDVTEVRGIQLEYVNVISQATVPMFATANRVQIAKILKYFAQPLLPSRQMVPPYQLTVNQEVSKEPPLTLLTKLTSIKNEAALRLDYKATTEQAARKIPIQNVKSEIDLAHSAIVAEFEASFTTEALESFGPYDVVPEN